MCVRERACVRVCVCVRARASLRVCIDACIVSLADVVQRRKAGVNTLQGVNGMMCACARACLCVSVCVSVCACEKRERERPWEG